jgi:hypothetical protein
MRLELARRPSGNGPFADSSFQVADESEVERTQGVFVRTWLRMLNHCRTRSDEIFCTVKRGDLR